MDLTVHVFVGIELKTNLPILNNLKSLIRAKAEELSRVHDQLHRDEVKSSQSAELGGVPDDLIRTQNNLKLRLGNVRQNRALLSIFSSKSRKEFC